MRLPYATHRINPMALMCRRVLAFHEMPGRNRLFEEMRSMPHALRWAALAAGAVALLATVAPGAAQEPIRIGVLQPMTGPATKNGTENFTAMQIARDMFNERGGINGRKVEFLLADLPTPTAAISETEGLTPQECLQSTLGPGVAPVAL